MPRRPYLEKEWTTPFTTYGRQHYVAVFVRDQQSIEAPFLTCYVALIIVKEIERHLGGKVETGRMVSELRKAILADLDGQTFKNVYCNNVIKKIGDAMGIDMTRMAYTKADLYHMVTAPKKIGKGIDCR